MKRGTQQIVLVALIQLEHDIRNTGHSHDFDVGRRDFLVDVRDELRKIYQYGNNPDHLANLRRRLDTHVRGLQQWPDLTPYSKARLRAAYHIQGLLQP